MYSVTFLVFGFLLLIYLSVYPSDVLIFSSLKILSFFLFNMWFSRYMSDTVYLLSVSMGLSGLEPPTSRLSGVRSNRLSYKPGYVIFIFYESGTHLLSHIVSNIVPSAAYVLTVVFGMGTGVSHKRISTGCL